MPVTKLEIQRAVRTRAERIKLNRMLFVRTKERNLVPFEELPDATFVLSDRDNANALEQFLLRNNLFAALREYRIAQNTRSSAQA